MSSLGSLGAEYRARAGDRGGASGVAARGRHRVPVGYRAGGPRGWGARAKATPRECPRPGDGRLGPFPTPTPWDAVGGKFSLSLFNLKKIFFFFLGKPSCLVTERSGLKKKKKAAAADAAGPECV